MSARLNYLHKKCNSSAIFVSTWFCRKLSGLQHSQKSHIQLRCQSLFSLAASFFVVFLLLCWFVTVFFLVHTYLLLRGYTTLCNVSKSCLISRRLVSRYSGYSKVIISCFFTFSFLFFWGGGGGEGFGVVQGFCLTLKLKLIFFVSCTFIEYMIL